MTRRLALLLALLLPLAGCRGERPAPTTDDQQPLTLAPGPPIRVLPLEDPQEAETAFEAARKPKKPKPPKAPPLPRPAGAFRAFGFYHDEDLKDPATCALPYTDAMFHITAGLMWGDDACPAGAHTDCPSIRGIRRAVAAAQAALPGKRLWAFYWAFGYQAARENPWAADEATWARHLSHVRAATAAGVHGHVADDEDEGRVARRDGPPSCAVTTQWWPRTPLLSSRAREYAAAVRPAQVARYAIVWMFTQPSGVDMRCRPVRVPGYGWIDWVNALGPYTLFAGDTYHGTTEAIIPYYWAALTTGNSQVPDYKVRASGVTYVPGTWLASHNLAAAPERLKLAAAAKKLTNGWWCYPDPGVLAKNSGLRGQLGTALK